MLALWGCATEPQPEATTPAARAVRLALPATIRAQPCPGREQRALPAPTELSVFQRRQQEPDGLPVLDADEGTSWLPAVLFEPEQVRRAGLGRFDAEVHLVPVVGIAPGGRCEPHPMRYANGGVCLTLGGGGAIAVRCFADEAIRGGRAIALGGAGGAGGAADVAHGIAPDGVSSVRVTWAGRSEDAPVIDNAFEVALSGARAGEDVTLEFSGPSVAEAGEACAPSAALRDAVPALDLDRSVTAPPEQLARVLDVTPALADRWARIWGGGDGLTFWVAPQLRCGVTVEPDRACVATVRETGVVEGAVCADAETIRARGASDWVPVDGRPVVAGLAPAGAGRARILVPEGARSVPVSGGVFSATLSREVRMDRPDAYRVEFEP